MKAKLILMAALLFSGGISFAKRVVEPQESFQGLDVDAQAHPTPAIANQQIPPVNLQAVPAYQMGLFVGLVARDAFLGFSDLLHLMNNGFQNLSRIKKVVFGIALVGYGYSIYRFSKA